MSAVVRNAQRLRRAAEKLERVNQWARAARVQAAPMRIAFRVPYPPSANGYWRSPNKGPLAGRVLISEEGRAYRRQLGVEIVRQRVPRFQLSGRLAISVMACCPDRRTRDLSNLWKGFLDALTHAGVIRDDGDFDDERIYRGPVVIDGVLYVEILELPGQATDSGGLNLSPPDAYFKDHPSEGLFVMGTSP